MLLDQIPDLYMPQCGRPKERGHFLTPSLKGRAKRGPLLRPAYFDPHLSKSKRPPHTQGYVVVGATPMSRRPVHRIVLYTGRGGRHFVANTLRSPQSPCVSPSRLAWWAADFTFWSATPVVGVGTTLWIASDKTDRLSPADTIRTTPLFLVLLESGG